MAIPKTPSHDPDAALPPAVEESRAADKQKEKVKADKKGKKDGKKKDKKKKEAVLIRFEDSQLEKVDRQAAALGLSRAAWVRMVVAQALAKG